jgi:putative membrane protein
VTIGALLKLLTLPLSIVTFGFFFLVINAFMFWAANFIKGFHVAGFWSAFFGSLIVTVVSMLGRHIIRGSGRGYHSQI